MKTFRNSVHGPIDLYALVNRVTKVVLPSAVKKQSFVINDLPHGLSVNADEHMLAAIYGSLLNTIIGSSANSCIRVSAKLYGSIVLLLVKENPGINHFTIGRKLKEVQQLAELFGGTVSIGNAADGSTSIVFSFINHQSMAA